MSKIGNYVVEMQEDAWDMSFEQFIEKHGSSQAQVWSAFLCLQQEHIRRPYVAVA